MRIWRRMVAQRTLLTPQGNLLEQKLKQLVKTSGHGRPHRESLQELEWVEGKKGHEVVSVDRTATAMVKGGGWCREKRAAGTPMTRLLGRWAAPLDP